MTLNKEIEASLDKCANNHIRKEYIEQLQENELTRDKNTHTHFCVYFVPYNPVDKTLLIGDHKKSGLWLMPGGHIDYGETLLDTVNREIEEELGVSNFFTQKPEPFLLSVTNVLNDVRPCKKHFDVWHIMETDGSNFKIDYSEYNEVRWVTVAEARELIVDPANREALDAIEKR